MESEKYWKGWFAGLSKIFQSIGLPKLQLLAGKENLDTELTVAQMQGKFKLICFPLSVGHCMMEDDPKETAKACHFQLDKFRICMNTDDLSKLKEFGIGKFKNTVKPYM